METAPKQGAGGRAEVVYLLFVTHPPAFRPRPSASIMYITYILNIAMVPTAPISHVFEMVWWAGMTAEIFDSSQFAFNGCTRLANTAVILRNFTSAAPRLSDN